VLTCLALGLIMATGSAASAGGGNKVTPILECAWNNGNGTYDVSFGYANVNGSPVTIPVGSSNYVELPAGNGNGQSAGGNGNGGGNGNSSSDAGNGNANGAAQSFPGQPTAFAVGTNQNVWVLRAVPVGTSWVIEGHRALLTSDSTACSSKQVSVIGSWSAAALGLLGGTAVCCGLLRGPTRNRRRRARQHRMVSAQMATYPGGWRGFLRSAPTLTTSNLAAAVRCYATRRAATTSPCW